MKWFHDRSGRHIGVFEGLLEYFGVTDEDRWHRSQPQVTDGSIFLGQVIKQFRGVKPTSYLFSDLRQLDIGQKIKNKVDLQLLL